MPFVSAAVTLDWVYISEGEPTNISICCSLTCFECGFGETGAHSVKQTTFSFSFETRLFSIPVVRCGQDGRKTKYIMSGRPLVNCVIAHCIFLNTEQELLRILLMDTEAAPFGIRHCSFAEWDISTFQAHRVRWTSQGTCKQPCILAF